MRLQSASLRRRFKADDQRANRYGKRENRDQYCEQRPAVAPVHHIPAAFGQPPKRTGALKQCSGWRQLAIRRQTPFGNSIFYRLYPTTHIGGFQSGVGFLVVVYGVLDYPNIARLQDKSNPLASQASHGAHQLPVRSRRRR